MSIHPWARIGGRPEHRDWIWNPDREWFPAEVDPTAHVMSGATVDGGCKQPTRVGARTILLTKSHVGHDAQVGEDCEIAPFVGIGGHVVIGDRVRVGLGAMFRPGVTVGDGARIGCGAIVVSDVPAGEVWVGNPAHRITHSGHPDREGLRTLTAS